MLEGLKFVCREAVAVTILGALAAFPLTNLMRNDIHTMLAMFSVYPGFLFAKCGGWLITRVQERDVMDGV